MQHARSLASILATLICLNLACIGSSAAPPPRVEPRITGDAELRWRAQVPAKYAAWSEQVGDLLYVYRDTILAALDVQTGRQLWQFRIRLPRRIEVTEDAVFIDRNDGALYALDPLTGLERWTYRPDGMARGIIPVGRTLYTTVIPKQASVEGILSYTGPADFVSLDAASGEVRWSVSERSTRGFVFADERAIYIGFDEELASLDPSTGRVRWRRTLLGAFQPGEIAVSDSRLFLIDNNFEIDEGMLYSLDPLTGTEFWHAELDPCHPGILQVFDDLVHVQCPDSGLGGGAEFFGFDTATGNRRWRVRSGESPESRAEISPNDAGDRFYEWDEDWLFAHDLATGAPAWEYTSGQDSLILSYDIGERDAYVASVAPRWAEGERHCTIVKLDARTGSTIWSVAMPVDGVRLAGTSPTEGGRVFVASKFAAMALDASSGDESWRLELPARQDSDQPPPGSISDVQPGDELTFVTTWSGDIFAIAEAESR
jgi:outer membrane protein assembly factor BamB